MKVDGCGIRQGTAALGRCWGSVPGGTAAAGTRPGQAGPRSPLVTRGSADVSPLDDRPSSASQTTLVAAPFAVSAAAQAPALGTGSAA